MPMTNETKNFYCTFNVSKRGQVEINTLLSLFLNRVGSWVIGEPRACKSLGTDLAFFENRWLPSRAIFKACLTAVYCWLVHSFRQPSVRLSRVLGRLFINISAKTSRKVLIERNFSTTLERKFLGRKLQFRLRCDGLETSAFWNSSEKVDHERYQEYP